MQTKQLVKASLLVLILSACGNSKEITTPTAEPSVNLMDQSMMSTLWMQHSFEAQVLREQQYKNAAAMLQRNLKNYKGDKRPAIILDIDETVLDNSPYEARIIKSGKAYSEESWGKWIMEAQADLVPGAKEFLRKAEASEVEIFYISNRDILHMEPTLENLRVHDLPASDESHVLLKYDDTNKTERRERVKNDYQVLLLVGDQLTDFIEETENFSADIPNIEGLMDSVLKSFVIMPNPMYGEFVENLNRGQTGLTDKQKDQYRRDALITKRKK